MITGLLCDLLSFLHLALTFSAVRPWRSGAFGFRHLNFNKPPRDELEGCFLVGTGQHGLALALVLELERERVSVTPSDLCGEAGGLSCSPPQRCTPLRFVDVSAAQEAESE